MTAESVVIVPNPDRSETIVEHTTFHSDKPTEESTVMDTLAYDPQTNFNGRVEIFKRHVQKIIHAMQFNKWAQEEN